MQLHGFSESEKKTGVKIYLSC